jgi:hypothetical protein
MMLFEASEATAARRRIPIVAVDDDGAIVTNFTAASTDLMVCKNGAAEAAFGGTLSSHLGGGNYYYEFTAAELGTFGYVYVRINKSGIQNHTYVGQVITHDQYGVYDCNATLVGGSSGAATILGNIYSAANTPTGVVETANVAATNSGTCTFQATGITETTADHYNGRLAIFISGVMAGSVMRITDYAWDAVNSQGMFTGTVMQETPVDGTSFIIL